MLKLLSFLSAKWAMVATAAVVVTVATGTAVVVHHNVTASKKQVAVDRIAEDIADGSEGEMAQDGANLTEVAELPPMEVNEDVQAEGGDSAEENNDHQPANTTNGNVGKKALPLPQLPPFSELLTAELNKNTAATVTNTQSGGGSGSKSSSEAANSNNPGGNSTSQSGNTPGNSNNPGGGITPADGTTTTTTTTPVAMVDTTGYTLVWNEEFSGNTLNRNDWNVEIHEPGWVNSELQEYVDSDENIQVKDGKLIITPVKKVNGDKVEYTSGRVSTQNKKTFTYGIFEARAKVTTGQGYLPAFWLMANDENIYGQWPRCGEIDCMEVMGQTDNKVYGTIHYGNPHSESQGTYTLPGGSFSSEFHTFTVEWLPGSIKWYVDGILYHQEDDWYSTTEGVGTLTYPAPFDQPFYVILNLAVGGSWVGFPDETTGFENNNYEIDYVRVYQKDSYDEEVEKPVKEIIVKEADNTGNYITNGAFSVDEDLSDETDWKFMAQNGGVASANISDGMINIAAENAGSEDYSVQLIQADLNFTKGAKYMVSFDAYADENRTMKTAVKAPKRGWKEYMPSKTVELTTESQSFSYAFVMTYDTDPQGRLEFNMGNAGSTAAIHIDNVRLEEIVAADPTAEGTKTMLYDGNYVYNGSFDKGDKRLGDWEYQPGTVEVTGFADGRRAKITAIEEVVILRQSELTFSTGEEYAFSFTAQAETSGSIKAIIGDVEKIWEIGTEKNSFEAAVTIGSDNRALIFEIPAGMTVYLDDVRLVDNSLFKNGSFSSGMVGYEVYVDASASATYVVDNLQEDKAISFSISNTSDADWKIQLKQNNIPLIKGKSYKLVLDAKSTIDREIRPIMQGGEERGWKVYSKDNIVALTSDFKTYEYTFTMNEPTDNQAFLSICLGAVNGRAIDSKHTVVIDNISFEEIDASLVGSESVNNTGNNEEPDISGEDEPEEGTEPGDETDGGENGSVGGEENGSADGEESGSADGGENGSAGGDNGAIDMGVVEEEMEAIVYKKTENNLLINDDFASMDGWAETIAEGAVAIRAVENGVIKYDIKNVGTDDWNVQLKQPNLHLEQDKTYIIAMDIVSSRNRNVKLCLLQDGTYKWYNEKILMLEAGKISHIEFEYTAQEEDYNAFVGVSLGKIGEGITPPSIIKFANVSIVEKN